MLEFISVDDNMVQFSGEVKRMHFTYTNKHGLEENYVVAIHYSLESDFTGLDYVIQKAIAFFKDWMTWMDKTIEVEDNSKIN